MRSHARSVASLLLPALAAAGLACGPDAPSPTAAPEAPAESRPALETAAATTPLSFRQVSAGLEHTCGVTTDDRAYCWGFFPWLGTGSNDEAEAPDECNTRPCSNRPAAVIGDLRFRQLSAGWQFTCGVTTEGRIYCWGRNESGQLGNGDTALVSHVPVEVLGGRRYVQVAAGNATACAITVAREAFCWGSNVLGQLGNGTTTPSTVPVRVARPLEWIQLTVGNSFTCGITTGKRAYCWGFNNGGRLGDGTIAQRNKPTKVVGDLLVRQISAGGSHTCAVTTGNRGYCWGFGVGAVGDGTTAINHLVPTPVLGDRFYDNISAGSGHSCGVTIYRRTFCWGANGGGQLGNGSIEPRLLKPNLVANDQHLVSVSAAHGFTCGVAPDSRGYCWGNNLWGALGVGDDDDRLVPTAVAPPH